MAAGKPKIPDSLWRAEGEFYETPTRKGQHYRAIYLTRISFDGGKTFLQAAEPGVNTGRHVIPEKGTEPHEVQKMLVKCGGTKVAKRMSFPKTWRGRGRNKNILGPHSTIASAKVMQPGYTFKFLINPNEFSIGMRGNVRFPALFAEQDQVVPVGSGLNVTVAEP